MENNANQQQINQHLCKMNCGFFGNQAFEGYCSKCYKEHVKRQNSGSAAGRVSPSTIATQQQQQQQQEMLIEPINMNVEPTPILAQQQVLQEKDLESDSTKSATISSSITDNDSKPKKRNRCDNCKKKVGLTGFDCRCGGLFCSEHRYSDKHDCKFNYKEYGQDQIRKANPVVVGEKIQKL